MDAQRAHAGFSQRWAGRLRSIGLWALVVTLVAACGSLAAMDLPTRAARQAAPAAAAVAPAALVYTQAPCAPVHTAPSVTAPLITQLLGGTDVTVLDSSTPGWSHIRIWSHTDGYMQTSLVASAPPATASEGNCAFPGVADPQPDVLPANDGPFPLSAQAQTIAPSTLYAWPGTGAPPLVGLPFGATVSVSQWASDGAGQPWYFAQTSAGAGWLWSGAARLAEPDPATHLVNGKPVWGAAVG
ncbi:MAG TPA: SH3 domain-containing protein, partial [Ktedonobacterales bacterium]